MSFNKSFDSLRDQILTDYRNAADRRSMIIDTSEGSEIFLKVSVLASLVWSIYKNIDWAARQILPTTCDSEWLDYHASRYGISRGSGEQDAALQQRLLAYFRNPLGGGNKYDYIDWAKQASVAGIDRPGWQPNTNYEFADVIQAEGNLYICCGPGTSGTATPTWDGTLGACVADGDYLRWKQWEAIGFVERVNRVWLWQNNRTAGSLDIVVDSTYDKSALTFNPIGTPDRYNLDTRAFFTGCPSNQLLSAVRTIIDYKRPLSAWNYRVQAVHHDLMAPFTVTLQESTTAGIAQAQTTADHITANLLSYILGMNACQSLNEASVFGIAFGSGVDSATLHFLYGDFTDESPIADGTNFIYPKLHPFTYGDNYDARLLITVIPAEEE